MYTLNYDSQNYHFGRLMVERFGHLMYEPIKNLKFNKSSKVVR